MSNVMKVVVAVGLVFSAGVAQADFFDNFDSYINADNPLSLNQGGWEGWDNNSAAQGEVSTDFSASSPNSAKIFGAADAVHSFTGSTSGVWELSVKQYVPSASVGGDNGNTYFILMNKYVSGGSFPNDYDWSVTWNCNLNTEQITSVLYGGNATTPILTDQWVDIKFIIDLGANSVTEYYNGSVLSTHAWTTGTVQGVTAIDLYAENSGPVYYDDMQLLAIPEPMTGTLLGVAALALLIRKRLGR